MFIATDNSKTGKLRRSGMGYPVAMATDGAAPLGLGSLGLGLDYKHAAPDGAGIPDEYVVLANTQAT